MAVRMRSVAFSFPEAGLTMKMCFMVSRVKGERGKEADTKKPADVAGFLYRKMSRNCQQIMIRKRGH